RRLTHTVWPLHEREDVRDHRRELPREDGEVLRADPDAAAELGQAEPAALRPQRGDEDPLLAQELDGLFLARHVDLARLRLAGEGAPFPNVRRHVGLLRGSLEDLAEHLFELRTVRAVLD